MSQGAGKLTLEGARDRPQRYAGEGSESDHVEIKQLRTPRSRGAADLMRMLLAQDAARGARQPVAVISCACRWDRSALVRDPPGRDGGMRLAAAKDASQGASAGGR